MAGEAP